MSPVELAGFEATAVPHMDTLYDAALRLTGERATAQDLTQETMLRALRSFSTFKPGTNCKAWLLRIQYNLFCTQYRKDRRLPLVWLDSPDEPSVEPPSYEPGPEEQAVREMVARSSACASRALLDRQLTAVVRSTAVTTPEVTRARIMAALRAEAA